MNPVVVSQTLRRSKRMGPPTFRVNVDKVTGNRQALNWGRSSQFWVIRLTEFLNFQQSHEANRGSNASWWADLVFGDPSHAFPGWQRPSSKSASRLRPEERLPGIKRVGSLWGPPHVIQANRTGRA